jgi:uncharacterized Fe-S cluster-containing radical SAM superfamily protein
MSNQKHIDTNSFARLLREKAIKPDERKLLVSVLAGSGQESDFASPANCNGLGRIRHFRHETAPGWPINPLPIVPAAKALGFADSPKVMTAQVFQNAACPWRCWYCFVPYNLLSADESRSRWVGADDLVQLYRREPEPPRVIDLSGGSPDLVPEWSVWMMDALDTAGLSTSTYLWSDDNLSTTYLFDELSTAQIDRLQSYPNYGRVCCFKGFDAESFSFNTNAQKGDFDRQFDIMARLLTLDIDLYGYLTLTAPSDNQLASKMSAFMDRLQSLDPHLPLRIVPLKIGVYGPVTGRLTPEREKSLKIQETAIALWVAELEARYSNELISRSICDIRIGARSTA